MTSICVAQKWQKGSVTMIDSVKFDASIFLDDRSETGVLMVKDHDKIKTLNPRVVQAFILYEYSKYPERHFISGKAAYPGEIPRPMFFEITHQGEYFSIYKKLALTKSTIVISVPFYSAFFLMAYNSLNFRAFTFLKNNETGLIISLNSKKKYTGPEDSIPINKEIFYGAIGDCSKETKRMVKSSKLNINNSRHLSAILDRCEALINLELRETP